MYVVVEIQKAETMATLVTSHETLAEAENKYHTVLAYAAVSEVPVHSAVMLTETGSFMKSECFTHM